MDELDQLHRKAVLWGVLVEADPSAEPAAPDSSRAECEVGTETGDIERPGDDDKVGGRIALEYHTVATSAHASLFLLQMDIHEQPSKRPRTGEDSSAPTVITSIEPTPTGPMPTMMTLPKLYVHACLPGTRCVVLEAYVIDLVPCHWRPQQHPGRDGGSARPAQARATLCCLSAVRVPLHLPQHTPEPQHGRDLERCTNGRRWLRQLRDQAVERCQGPFADLRIRDLDHAGGRRLHAALLVAARPLGLGLCDELLA